VGRNPKKTQPEDLLFKSRLLDASVSKALENTRLYLTVGLAYDSYGSGIGSRVMENVIAGCKQNSNKLVF
jgi:hypothetical protein